MWIHAGGLSRVLRNCVFTVHEWVLSKFCGLLLPGGDQSRGSASEELKYEPGNEVAPNVNSVSY